MDQAYFWKGALLCTVSALGWAISGPLSRLSFEGGATPGTVAFGRLAISGLCFLLHVLCMRERMVSGKDTLIFALFGVFNVALFYLFFLISVEKSGSALAIVLMFTAPAWVAVFSRIFFHEAIDRTKAVSVLTALAGIIMVCSSGGSLGGAASYAGIAAGVACGLLYAFQFIFFSWWKGRYSTASMFAFSFLPAALFLSFFAEFRPLSPAAWTGIAVPGVVSAYFAYYLYGRSLLYLTPLQAAVIGNLEPVAATFLSWWFWDENFTAAGWLGCLLVIGSVALMAVLRKKA